MDSELRFISCLLRSNPAEQTTFWEKQLPVSLFKLHELEVQWIYQFRQKYGKFPSPEAFLHKFDENELKTVNDPLPACLEPVMTNAAYADIRTVLDRTAEMFSEKKEPAEIVETFRSLAEKVQTHAIDYVDEDMNDPLTVFKRYRDLTNGVGVRGRYIQTPWPVLNRLISFVRPGELFIITARPNIGKTWLLLFLLDFLAKAEVRTFLLSKEMPTASIADRVTAIRYGLDWEKFRTGTLDINDQVRWKIAMRRQRKKPYTLIVSGEETMEGTGMEHLHAKVLKEKPQAVAIDGAYLLKMKSLNRNASPVEQATEISRGLKRLAKVTQTQVFAVIQMGRAAETKGGVAQGNLSQVYGSDSWAQDADFLMNVGGERGTNERVLSMLKCRDAAVGDLFVNFSLTPKPDFSGKSTLSATSALNKVPFKIIR